MELNPTVRERIFSVADQLYAESGKASPPTVDAVRKQAKVSMNDACTGMREWRKTTRSQVSIATDELPTALIQANTAALHALWHQATTLANEALQAAQTAWQAERSETEVLSQQMASAYENQVLELEQKAAQLTHLAEEGARQAEQMAALQQRADALSDDNILLTATTEQARARIADVEQHAADLRRELDQAFEALTASLNSAAELRQAQSRECQELRRQLEGCRQQVTKESAAHNAELRRAREDVATLQGKLSALQPSAPASKRRRKDADDRKDGAIGKIS